MNEEIKVYEDKKRRSKLRSWTVTDTFALAGAILGTAKSTPFAENVIELDLLGEVSVEFISSHDTFVVSAHVDYNGENYEETQVSKTLYGFQKNDDETFQECCKFVEKLIATLKEHYLYDDKIQLSGKRLRTDSLSY